MCKNYLFSQQLGIYVAGSKRRKPNYQILLPANLNNRRRQRIRNGRRKNNNRRQGNNRNNNNNNNLGVFGSQQQGQMIPVSKLPIAYPEPMPAYPNNNMNPFAVNGPPPYNPQAQPNWPPPVVMPVQVQPTYPEGTEPPPTPPSSQRVSDETMPPMP